MGGGAHKDRLSVVDNSFLDLEKDATHMHVGGLMVFEGPPLAYDDALRHIEGRLHLVPRYRQKVATPPLRTGRPLWIDDPCFNLEYHVRHTALPRPGGMDQLRRLAARIFSQRLDRSKPLWEIWLIEGLEDGRFAQVNKTHHALIDGMAGVDLMSLLFDASREPREVPPPERPFAPSSTSGVELLAESAKGLAQAPASLVRRALGAARRPGETLSEARESVEGIAQILGPGLVNPAPSVPLNTSIGPHRRVQWVSASLDDFKTVKNALGGTVNDVVLAVVTGALRRWLRSRGVSTDGLELRAMVPVSIRADAEQYQFGNRVAAMRGPLPVYAAEPVDRLRLVSEAMQGLKESKQALGAERLTGLQEFAPPTLLAQGARVNFSTRLFNVIVTNVPGPQFPVYLLGRQLEQLVPFAFLPKDHAISFAIMSYNGRVDFGLLGDYDAMPDLAAMAAHVEASLGELVDEAGGASAAGAGRFERASAGQTETADAPG